MQVKKLNRTIFQRILGRPATALPENNDFWSVSNGKITVDLSKAPALAKPGGAVRLERNLSKNVLVVHGEDGAYHAYDNKCTHNGRRVDPVPGTETVQCCSMGCATFNLDGNKIAGPAKGPLHTYPVSVEDGKLVIEID
jgi:nitrite reductase/ring-hydroxylating ferredoxin subunit